MKDGLYTLKINSPCGEDWSAMSRAGMGRHCSSCSKTVIDFTGRSDAEIARILSTSEGTICGRLLNTQLNRPLEEYQKTGPLISLYKFVAGVAFVTGFQNLRAAVSPFQPVPMETIPFSPLDKDESSIEKAGDTATNLIRGKVVDLETGEVLSFAQVAIISNEILLTGIMTDVDGNFILTIPDSLATNTFTLLISYPGYATQEIQIDGKTELVFQKVRMVQGQRELMGYVRIIVPERKWWQFWR